MSEYNCCVLAERPNLSFHLSPGGIAFLRIFNYTTSQEYSLISVKNPIPLNGMGLQKPCLTSLSANSVW
jgi:hypothetical protein